MSDTGRKQYIYNGQLIYEWEQNLEEILIFIIPPNNIKAKDLNITITSTHLKVGIKGQPLFIDDDLNNKCVASNSLWMLEDGVINITLQKSSIGETWVSVIKGHTEMDPIAIQEEQKRLMRERFSRENPGFDFSNASFNGDAPDPHTFMGGTSASKFKK